MKQLKVLDTAEKLSSNIKIGDDVVLLGLQHLTPTTVSLFERLIKKGLRPENIYLMGKCYSANPINFLKLSELGIKMSERSFYFNSYESYDETLKESVFQFFKETASQIDFSKCKKVILLDDGATLLSAASQLLPENIEVIGIEQTSAGYHRAKKSKVPFPIINVARSRAKLDYESSFVARTVCTQIKEHMKTIPFKINNILILGSGYIGKSVYNYLASSFNVDIYDPKTTPNSEKKSLDNYDLIIGCTGETSVSLDELKQVTHNLALISASSSDREFPALELRREVEEYHYFSKNLLIDNVYLINSGFPVNFDDHYLDSYEFELTRSLLFLGVLQAVAKNYSRLHAFIDVIYQDEIIKSYLNNYTPVASTAESLNRTKNEISFPLVHKLVRGLCFDAFKHLENKVKNRFINTPVHYMSFPLSLA